MLVFPRVLAKAQRGSTAPAQMLVCLKALAGRSGVGCACKAHRVDHSWRVPSWSRDPIQGPGDASRPEALGR